MKPSVRRLTRLTALVLSAMSASLGAAVGIGQSLVLNGNGGSIAIPNRAPFTAIGSTRVEMRLYNISAVNSVIPFEIFALPTTDGGKEIIRIVINQSKLCTSDWEDSTGGLYNCTPPGMSLTGLDLTVRQQRDTTGQVVWTDIFNSQTGALIVSGSLPMNPAGGIVSLQNGVLGGPNVDCNVAWIKWNSTLVPVGSAMPSLAEPADLADWRFEGTLANQGASGYAVKISGLANPVFTSTPIYLPACNAGFQQSFRAGFPATLRGSGVPLDGSGILQYSWAQTSGPSTVGWSSQTIAQPTVTGTVFGTYVFQLTVTDGSGQSTSCSVRDGAVATDENNVVVTATGNASLDSAVTALIGPMIRLGANPWPFYDTAATVDAALQIAQMDIAYAPYWNVPGPGTVTVAAGSNLIEGSGTTFTTTFCGGPVNPGTPQPNANIIVWYLTGRTVNGVSETGRLRMFVGACQSDTQMTVTCCGPQTWPAAAPAGSGLQYTPSFLKSAWDFTNAPANYYDNVQAYYELYYRSGNDIYLAAARKLADRFWTCPQIDRGMAFVVGDGFGQQVGRSNEISGLILRALDTADGRPDMWEGLHKVWTYNNNWLNGFYKPGRGGFDARDQGFVLAEASYCALFDTDPAWQATCRAAIQRSFQPGTNGVFPQFLDPVQQGILVLYSQKASWDTGQPWSGSTVTLTSGSNSVVCNSGNCNWQASDFSQYDVNTQAPCSSGSTCAYVPVLFTDSAALPANSTHTDPHSYCYPAACTFVDSNHFTLDRPYDGVSGTHGWTFGVLNGAISFGVVGWGNLPYMEGILGWAFNLAGQAMACTGTGVPANCDNATSQLAYSFSQNATAWITKYGAIPQYYGLSYFAGFPVCGSSADPNNIWCNRGFNNTESREIMGDAYRGLAASYRMSPNSALAKMIDNWYAGMWAKPGTGPVIPSPDGQYDVNFDGSSCEGCGFYLAEGPPYSQKFFGQQFGISNESSWPAIRPGRLHDSQCPGGRPGNRPLGGGRCESGPAPGSGRQE